MRWRSLRVLSRPDWLAASELRIGLGCTYLTRAFRSHELETAARHDLATIARREPGPLAPTSQMRAVRY